MAWDRIHNTYFFKFTNGPDKLEFYITLAWNNLEETNALAY